MSKLFLDVLGNKEFVNGYQIEDSVAQKYNLKPGSICPFTGLRVEILFPQQVRAAEKATTKSIHLGESHDFAHGRSPSGRGPMRRNRKFEREEVRMATAKKVPVKPAKAPAKTKTPVKAPVKAKAVAKKPAAKKPAKAKK